MSSKLTLINAFVYGPKNQGNIKNQDGPKMKINPEMKMTLKKKAA